MGAIIKMHDHENAAPPREVWVVSSHTGPDFVTAYRQGAMEHASELAGDFPENGPYRVCRYVAEPFAQPIDVEEMRLTLITQIYELIDIAERHLWTDDEDEKRRTQGAINYARKAIAPYNYNGGAS